MDESIPSLDRPPKTARTGRRVWNWIWPALLTVLVALGIHQYLRWQRDRATPTEEEARFDAEISQADSRLEAARREAEKLDGPWRMEDIEARMEKIDDKDNSALILRQVEYKMPGTWFNPRVNARFSAPSRRNAEELKKRRAQLDRASEALALARVLADRPHGRMAIAWTNLSQGTTGLLPSLGSAADLLMEDAVLSAQENDFKAALTACQALFNAATVVGDIPTYNAQLMRVEDRDVALRILEEVLATGEAPVELLTKLQKRIGQEADQPLLLLVARGQRAFLDRLCQALRDGQVPISSYVGLGLLDKELMQKEPSPLVRKRLNSLIVSSHAILLEKCNRRVEILKLPPEQHTKLQELAKSSPDEPVLVGVFFSIGPLETEGWRKSQARLHCATIALAAERYRRQQGRWPDKLADLAPNYLSAVPSDPISGKPFRFGRQEEGLVVYSVGFDGKDGGGRFATLGTPSNDDIGFRLWNVERRPLAKDSPKKP
jgi:hypothetical protein